MYIDPMIVELADRNTRKWPEIIRRAEILRRYANAGRLTADQLTSCAGELGCGKRGAYYLIQAFRARSLGEADPRSKAATSRQNPSETIVASDASSHDQGVAYDGILGAAAADVPAVLTYKQRFGASGAIRRKLQLHESVHAIVDSAGLDMIVNGSCSRSAGAFLLALIDADDGSILGHRLVEGRPTKEDVGTVLASLSDPGSAVVVRSAAIRDDMLAAFMPIITGDLDAPSGRRPRPGFPLHAVLGSMIGRVRIISRGTPQVDHAEAVPIEIAAKAVGLLVERHNEAIATKRLNRLRS